MMAKTRSSRRSGPHSPNPGLKLTHSLQGHIRNVNALAFDSRGSLLASGGDDGTIRLWDASTGKLIDSLHGRSVINGLAFAPDAPLLCSGGEAGVTLWDVTTRRVVRTAEGVRDVNAIAFAPNGRVLASVGSGLPILFEVATFRRLRAFESNQRHLMSVAFGGNGRFLAAGGRDGVTTLWDTANGALLNTFGEIGEHRQSPIYGIAFAPDGHTLAIAGSASVVTLWDVVTGRRLHTLEGHTSIVDVVAFSADGQLFASKSNDDTIRVWSCATWNPILVIPELKPGSWIPALAFHPAQHVLATAGSSRRARERADASLVHLWTIDVGRVVVKRTAQPVVRYKNAKVVLLGDTGVGKSGLALRMTEDRFEATESTHGRRVWTLASNVAKGPGKRPDPRETHEILLWDLAGQAAYRLVHQLSIDEAAVALVVVDARSELDPLGAAEYWAKAIDQARASVRIRKFLVEARNDRGGLAVSRDDLNRFCEKFGFEGFFSTSAKTGQGVDELTQAVRDAIPWKELPEVISTDLFTKIKEVLKQEKERGDHVLVEQLHQFRQRLNRKMRKNVTEAEFRAVIGRLEASSLAWFLVFTALNGQNETADYVLMQPEYIDAYASAVVNQARQDPRGIGHVSEEELRRGTLSMADDDRIPDREAERLVIGETIEQLLRHDIALRERLSDGNYLVFPSQYTRSSPYPRTGAAGVAYEFDGACRAIFTTLVVRFTHHKNFVSRDFWRDAARYEVSNGGRCIVVLDELTPSRGRLSVFFENNPPVNERAAFLRYVFRHLAEKAVAGSVVAHRENRCPACGHPWPESVVESRLKLGKRDIVCPNCDTRSPLIDLLFNPSDPAAKAEAELIDSDARVARQRELAVAAIRGKEQFGQFDVFMSYSSADRDQVVVVAEMLEGVGIRPWLDVWNLVPGCPWQEGLESAIANVKSAAIFLGGSGQGPWQKREMRAFLEEFVRRGVPVIPVLLAGSTEPPDLPVFLRSFSWVDLSDLRKQNPEPLAGLVAGVLGRTLGEMRQDSLAEQVSAMLAPHQAGALTSQRAVAQLQIPTVTLPVNRPELSNDELDAVVLQTAQLLGLSSSQVRLVRTEPGSVRIILQLDDMVAVSQLFAMAGRGDPTVIEFFRRCQIDVGRFEEENRGVPQEIEAQREVERRNQPDDLDRRIGNLPEGGLRQWAGGTGVATIAIVFTDIVDSTQLCVDLGDAPWDEIRQRHFARVQQLIREYSGFFIKNTGDGVLAAFHNAGDAVSFSVGVLTNTGHAVIRVRVGIHVGPVTIETDDAFGRNVNMAARVMTCLAGDGLVISEQAMAELDLRKSPALGHLDWHQRPPVHMKGLDQPHAVWELRLAR